MRTYTAVIERDAELLLPYIMQRVGTSQRMTEEYLKAQLAAMATGERKVHEMIRRFGLATFRAAGQLLEAERLEQRTIADLEMITVTGMCPGIENYSRFLTGRRPGEPPPTLFEYLPDNALLIVDEFQSGVGITGKW